MSFGLVTAVLLLPRARIFRPIGTEKGGLILFMKTQ